MNQCNLVLTDGGAGDLICELVAVDYNIKNHPHVHFHVWVPDYLIPIAKHLLPRGTNIRPFSKAKAKFRQDIGGLSTEWATDHTPMRTHPVDYGFHMLSDRHIYRLSDKNYLQIRPEEIDLKKFKLPPRYACIAATFAEPVKTMPIESFNAILGWLIERDIRPVLIGREEACTGFQSMKLKGKTIDAEFDMCLNLINKTDLLECAGIIHNSCAYIGMDGGLTHLAGCTDALIFSGYSLVDPMHVAPIRQGSQTYKFHPIEPDDLPNRYYQTYHSGFRHGDFRLFDGWEKIVGSLTPKKFIKALNENVVL